MPITEKIKEIEREMARTQKNKATEGHLGMLKAKLAKLRAEQQLEDSAKSSGGGTGFAVSRSGSGTVALIGFPSAGKSTLLSELTSTESESADYAFTTLTCIPGNLFLHGTKIQILDLPGIIEGAYERKGGGREVIATAKSADMVLLVLDAAKEGEKGHKEILERELHKIGIRLNSSPADVVYRPRATGGIKLASTVKLTKLGEDWERTVTNILKALRITNGELLFREDASDQDVIDIVTGTVKYMPCLTLYTKADMVSVEMLDELARRPHSLVCSVKAKLGLEDLKEGVWEYLGLRRAYCKPRHGPPDFGDPIVLTKGRGGLDVKAFCTKLHSSFVDSFSYAILYGRSAKFPGQRVGLSHEIADEDVLEVITKTYGQLKASKDYSETVQAHWDALKKKKKAAKGKLKT